MIKLYALMVSQVARFSELTQEEGQTLAEYALILALIAAVVVGVVLLLGGDISSIFSGIASAL